MNKKLEPNNKQVHINKTKDNTGCTLNSIKQATTDPAWIGMATEGYVFAALVFWIFCFGMSRYSMRLERKLDTGHKR